MACHVCTGGGFLTGWKGWFLLLLGVAVAVVVGGTGYLGSMNSMPKLKKAEVKFLDIDTSALP
jgi:hypothetical protein